MLGHTKEFKFLKSLAEAGNLAHGYIFFGAEGVGKKRVALELCKFLERQGGENALLQDAKFLEPDDPSTGLGAGTISIDAAREARAWLWMKPAASPRRTLVVNDAERLTGEAENALLKIAEDPPGEALLIFITRDPELLLPTVASRFQKVYFSPVPEKDVADWLMKEYNVSREKAALAARRSFGRPGLAHQLCFDEKFQATLAQAEKFLRGSLVVKDFVKDETFNLGEFLGAVALVLSWSVTPNRVEGRGAGEIPPRLWHALLALQEQAARYNLNPRIQLEALAMQVQN